MVSRCDQEMMIKGRAIPLRSFCAKGMWEGAALPHPPSSGTAENPGSQSLLGSGGEGRRRDSGRGAGAGEAGHINADDQPGADC